VLARRARLHLDLDLAGTPITGELTVEGGPPRPFTGYAGLIAALEAILGDAHAEHGEGTDERAPSQYP
jgi:hypothetical protein